MIIFSLLRQKSSYRFSALWGAVRIAALASLLLSGVAQAGVVIGMTRAIVTGADNMGSVQLMNQGTQPALLQLWVDNSSGEMDQPIGSIKVPLVIDTPVFRLDGNSHQWVRIFYANGVTSLPSDRESLFWLNVLEVPPKSATGNTQSSEVQIAFRSRIKLFYRPAGIPDSAQGVEQQLVFQQATDSRGAVALRIVNPTPFHVTLVTLELSGKERKRIPVDLGRLDMLAPKQSLELALDDPSALSAKDTTVFFSIINDSGSTIESEQALTR